MRLSWTALAVAGLVFVMLTFAALPLPASAEPSTEVFSGTVEKMNTGLGQITELMI